MAKSKKRRAQRRPSRMPSLACTVTDASHPEHTVRIEVTVDRHGLVISIPKIDEAVIYDLNNGALRIYRYVDEATEPQLLHVMRLTDVMTQLGRTQAAGK